MNMDFKRKLPIPKEVKEAFPLTPELEAVRDKNRDEICKVFLGESDKFLLIIGPCSADNRDAVIEYLSRLKKVSDEVKDKIVIVPRIYTNKPRTRGDGYMGMLHQPDPDVNPDMLKGIVAIRDLHMSALREFGFSSADEMLYPDNYRYLSDLLSYVAIGARSVEDQQHRLTVSGFDIPAGMKNPTSGDLTVMLNSVYAAQHSHSFIYRGWEVKTDGNPLAHTILRGSVNKYGRSYPNYHYEDLDRLIEVYQEMDVVNPAIIIDSNHNNSNKKFDHQPRIVKEVLHSRKLNSDIRTYVKGVMIESYIEEGCQKIGEGIYGKSITDPCLGWEASEKLIYDIAENA